MILTKLKLNKVILIVAVLILGGLVGYFFPHKLPLKEVPVLYKVVEIIDGDTIQAEINNEIETVRLLGIDTPEISSPYTTEECFGQEASEKTKELLKSKEIYLIPDPQGPDRDKYGRILRYIFLPDGEFVNAELIKGGYAFDYIYEPFQFMKQFDYLEKQAKESRLGLWGEKCNYYFEVETE